MSETTKTTRFFYSDASEDFTTDDSDCLGELLVGRQVIYLKGFTRNSVKKEIPRLIAELDRYAKAEKILIVWDGDNLADMGDGPDQSDFTVFIKEYATHLVESKKDVVMLAEPSTETADDQQLPIGDLPFYRLHPAPGDKGSQLQKYATTKGIDFSVVNGVFTNLYDSDGKTRLPEWAFYKVKGMILLSYLEGIKREGNIIIYCLGGGEIPMLEHGFIYEPEKRLITSQIQKKLRTGNSFCNWYLASPESTHSRCVKNKQKEPAYEESRLLGLRYIIRLGDDSETTSM